MAAPTRERAILLVNQTARRVRDGGWVERVRAALDQRFDVEVRTPASAEETSAAAREAGADERAIVVAVGGDGTVSAVAHGLAGTGGRLGILPLGTANDLARELGLPRDPGDAAVRIGAGRVHRTDLVSVNGRHFTTVGGLGLVSRSTVSVARMRAGPASRAVRLLGAAVYRVAAAGSMLAPRITSRARVTWRDPATGVEETRELDLHGIFVTNHTMCGGGLVIPTGGRADDGVFELAMIPATSRTRLLVNLERLSSGRPLTPDILTVVRADRAVIETETPDVFAADGDVLATAQRFVLESHPGAVGIVR